jgi:general secretion pathway protein G
VLIRSRDCELPSWQRRIPRAVQTGRLAPVAPAIALAASKAPTRHNVCSHWGMTLRVSQRSVRRRVRGVTLVEVLIVVAIIALVSAGVAVAVFPNWGRAQQKAATANARNLRGAVKTWWVEHDPSLCPDINQLIRDQALDRDSPRTDPWGTPWRIECADHDVTILSDGSDRTAGTSDDIRIPPTS